MITVEEGDSESIQEVSLESEYNLKGGFSWGKPSRFLLFVALDVSPVFSQIKIDDGPIITGAPNGRYVTVRSWGRNNITYSFKNGTDDIAGIKSLDIAMIASFP
jgi:hypothetical protein